MRYYYMAFIPDAKRGFSIFSPDFKEIASQGDTLPECMDMSLDALHIVTEAYAKAGKPLPDPCDLAEARRRIRAELESLDSEIPDGIVYQLVAAPEASMSLVKISATFTRRTLDIIDMKAKAHGMTRSGFLAAAAQAYS